MGNDLNKLPLALIIEDSEDQLALLQRLLEREGFWVLAAINAESALPLLEEEAPELAIVDLLLPGMTGGEIAALIQQRFPDCAVVISSVLDTINYPEADAALPKPVTSASLHEMIVGLAA